MVTMLPRPQIRSRTDSRGNVILVVVFIALTIMAFLFSVSFMTRSDVSSSTQMLRELHATHMGESVAAQVEALTNNRPWTQRFWLLESLTAGNPLGLGVEAKHTFGKSSRYVHLGGDTLPDSEYDFTAVVKDLPDRLREYRLLVEVTVRGQSYVFSWDKRWDQSLLAGMNHDGTMMDKPLEDLDGAASGAADLMIDTIKNEADTAPPPEGATADQIDRLARMRRDEPSFVAIAIVPDPAGTPLGPTALGGAP